MSKKIKPTSAKEWAKIYDEGELVQLPGSGNIVRLRPVSLVSMLETGEIPDILSPLAAKVLWDGMEALDGEGKSLEDTKNTVALASLVCIASFIEPAIVDSPDPVRNQISVDMIEDHDKMAVLALATGASMALSSFRPKQGPDVETVSNGEDKQQ